MMMFGLATTWAAVLGSIAYGSGDFIGGYVTRRLGTFCTVAIAQSVAVAFAISTACVQRPAKVRQAVEFVRVVRSLFLLDRPRNASATSLRITNMTTATSIELRPIDGLRAYSGNARTHSKKQIAQIASSIERFGFTNPVLISDDGEILSLIHISEPTRPY